MLLRRYVYRPIVKRRVDSGGRSRRGGAFRLSSSSPVADHRPRSSRTRGTVVTTDRWSSMRLIVTGKIADHLDYAQRFRWHSAKQRVQLGWPTLSPPLDCFRSFLLHARTADSRRIENH